MMITRCINRSSRQVHESRPTPIIDALALMSRAVGGDLIEEVRQHQIAAPGHQPSDMIAAMAPTFGAADFELQVIGEVGEDLGAVAGQHSPCIRRRPNVLNSLCANLHFLCSRN